MLARFRPLAAAATAVPALWQQQNYKTPPLQPRWAQTVLWQRHHLTTPQLVRPWAQCAGDDQRELNPKKYEDVVQMVKDHNMEHLKEPTFGKGSGKVVLSDLPLDDAQHKGDVSGRTTGRRPGWLRRHELFSAPR